LWSLTEESQSGLAGFTLRSLLIMLVMISFVSAGAHLDSKEHATIDGLRATIAFPPLLPVSRASVSTLICSAVICSCVKVRQTNNLLLGIRSQSSAEVDSPYLETVCRTSRYDHTGSQFLRCSCETLRALACSAQSCERSCPTYTCYL